MSIATPPDRATHEVFNQVPPLENRNLFLDNAPLVEALEREGGGWAAERARGRRVLGRRAAGVGPPGEREPAGAADARPLRQPHRRGRVPSGVAPADGGRQADDLHALPWNEPREGAHVARAAIYMSGDAGRGRVLLPDHDDVRGGAGAAGIRTGRRVGARAACRVPTTARCGLRTKDGATCGMAMTEKQGGSDVRANTTVATPLDGERASTRSSGTSGSASAPMCDVFLVLAQTDEGITCFVLPRDPARRHEATRASRSSA